ncbi:DUF7691 family protein [Spirillospora sp. CA-294931]|uniref:DUF7691 family protein n=1 Tax=Spirillospora sp. CA-294931 TaxID=3240042 RepID=UPI003D8CDEE3
MSTQLTIYSVSIENARLWVRRPPPGMREGCRRRAATADEKAVDDLFGDRPLDPDAGDAYARVWRDVIEHGESTRFDLGPLRLGARYLADASREFEDAGVPRDLTPASFVYDTPFPTQARNAPVIGHVPAERVPALREAYGTLADRVEASDLVKVLLAAADETLHFNAFARDFPDGPLPPQDLVTFYG